MTWAFTADVEEYAAAAEAWLLRDPVRNTVLLTVLRGLRSGQFAEDPLMGWFDEDGSVTGAVSHTPPYPLGLGDVPHAVLPSLATGLIELDRSLPGVSGPLAAAEAFAAAWWRPEKGRRAERLYRLGALAPSAAPGKARTATAADIAEAALWFGDFQAEAHVDRTADPTPVVSARINRDELVWWEDGGRSVSIAGVTAPIAGMSRIGPVFTPPEFRRHGYGTAVTHAASRKAMDEGAAGVLLFTDLGNPTSNSIYQSLGYRPVDDYATIHFG
ncbi:GNAT family N-acetyltransferase [Planotetraspora sp. A-T 1434]|uniref:GNAT family N-acetyltransferase n=1 Tax=Planotetraspora sp. A-T 1434 TaxID=2979219 RepID=UPI0021BEFE23|nr:GNAT family N-acetyltransferase [Planotetraspora sp. A-T 1434]MCT9933839.1 GNAT family N-acetyltransferase [Planotetraspora sp. A-T 1434]